MHKWFARRASCVFRAILLGALKPAGTNIMEEFYKDHSNDPDTNGKVVLDPFMGGGTTIVEALRLACKVVGIDLNPVAWFIVKTQVESVDSKELDAAFERLVNNIVPWSGRPLRQTLLDLYQTAPPWMAEEVCGLSNSDVIYTFWVHSAVCTSPTCRKHVPLFPDYVVAAKSPSIRYYPDCKCPKCDADFDWEVSMDSISKSTRGFFEVSDLTGHKPPLLRKGRVKGGRTYEVLTPSERLDGLRQTLRGVESNAQQLALLAADDNTPIAFGPELVDVIHLLAGNAEQNERLDHLVERFRGQREQIRAALQYLKQRDPDRWSKSADKLLPFYDDLFAQSAAQKGAH